MKVIFIICTTLTISQVLDVTIDGVSAAEPQKFRTKKQNVLYVGDPIEAYETKTITTRGLNRSGSGRNSAVNAVPQNQQQTDDEEYMGQGQFVDGEPEQTGFFGASKQLIGSVVGETGRRSAGALNTATGVVKASSGVLGFFGSLVRDQVKNIHRLASVKTGMLSDAGRSLTNGAVNFMQSTQELGAGGAQALSGTFRSATNLGKTGTKLGGAVAGGLFKMTDDGLKVIKRGASIAPKVTGTVSNAALNAMSTIGVHSDEAENDQGFEDDTVQPQAPVQKPKTPPTSSNRRTLRQ